MIGQALERLRDVDPHDREAWAEVRDDLLSRRSPWIWSRDEADEVVQRTLIDVSRKLDSTRGGPAQLGSWVRLVWRSRAIDTRRRRMRQERNASGLDDTWRQRSDGVSFPGQYRSPITDVTEPVWRDPERPSLLDHVDGTAVLRDLIGQVLDAVNVEPLRPTDVRPRTMAAATLDRLVWGLSPDEIARRHGASTAATASKWVERGRPHVARAARRWAREDEWALGVADVLVELVERRRADAGQTRGRRSSAQQQAGAGGERWIR